MLAGYEAQGLKGIQASAINLNVKKIKEKRGKPIIHSCLLWFSTEGQKIPSEVTVGQSVKVPP